MRPIQEGEIVDVYFSEQVITDAIVLHVPADTGDLWYLRIIVSAGTMIIAVNPNSSDFVRFEKKELIETPMKEE